MLIGHDVIIRLCCAQAASINSLDPPTTIAGKSFEGTCSRQPKLEFLGFICKADFLIRVLLHREMQPQRLLRYRKQSRAANSYLDLPRHRLLCIPAKKFNGHAYIA
jgi:hypothetical protein